MFCVRGSESRSCRLVLKTLELNSVSTKTDIYLILLITHQKFVRSQKIEAKIGSQTTAVRLSRQVKQPNVGNFKVCS